MKMTTKKEISNYDSDSIKNLQFPDSVRHRPGMYIGSTDQNGVFVILREVLDNGCDECSEGHATTIDLAVGENEYWIADDGRGIPSGTTKVKNPADGSITQVSTLRAVFGILHTSGKFSDEAYKISRGVNGIGVKGTNALSSEFEVWTRHSSKWSRILFHRGILKAEESGCGAPIHPITGKKMVQGTLIRFIPDTKIFSSVLLPKMDLFSWAKMAAYFNAGMTVNLFNKTSGKTVSLHYPRGPIQYVEDRLVELTKSGEFGLLSDLTFQSSSAVHDCVLKFTSYDGCDAKAFTNGLTNSEGGFHLSSMLNALKDSLRPYVGKKQVFGLNELKDGLVGLINAKMSGPHFDSQTKDRLVDARAGQPLKDLLLLEFAAFFKKNKTLALAICERASRLKDLKSKFVASKQMLTALKKISKKGLPAKAATAPGCKPEDRETYLLEGDSACFIGDTPVLTSEGILPMSSLTSPWRGPAYDDISDEMVEAEFSPAFSVRSTTDLVAVLLNDGSVYRCTPDHVWFTRNHGQVAAEDLVKDEEVIRKGFLRSAGGTRILSVTRITLKTPVPVYDVTNLSGNQTFCLGNGCVVHNCAGMRFARDVTFQEFLPLKGKPQNMQRAKSAEVESVEILNIFAMIGLDPRNADPLSHLRTGKIIIMPDADADGSHIAVLILAIFKKFLPDMFERDMIYVTRVPEYYAIHGKTIFYGDSAAQLSQDLQKAGAKATINHLKGYAECPSDLLKIFACDPATRLLYRVRPASDDRFELLMSNDSSSRKLLLGI